MYISIYKFAFEWELRELRGLRGAEPLGRPQTLLFHARTPLGPPQTPLFHARTPLGPQQGLPQPPQTPLFHARAPLEAPQTPLFAVLEPLGIRKTKETRKGCALGLQRNQRNSKSLCSWASEKPKKLEKAVLLGVRETKETRKGRGCSWALDKQKKLETAVLLGCLLGCLGF